MSKITDMFNWMQSLRPPAPPEINIDEQVEKSKEILGEYTDSRDIRIQLLEEENRRLRLQMLHTHVTRKHVGYIHIRVLISDLLKASEAVAHGKIAGLNPESELSKLSHKNKFDALIKLLMAIFVEIPDMTDSAKGRFIKDYNRYSSDATNKFRE